MVMGLSTAASAGTVFLMKGTREPLLGAALALVLIPFVSTAEWAPFTMPETFDHQALPLPTRPPVTPRTARVVCDEGHFAADGTRYKIWGVNTCFGANLPTPPQAAAVAERLAALGINNVRLHHLDTSPFPDGLFDPANPARLHPEALARLDAFVDQLARHGIRVNLNLHVGRNASRALGLPAPGTDYDKIVGLFTPALIDAQKQTARDLLGRTNTCRGITWAADPAVAFVEISNEDSFFMWDAEKRLRALPPYYAAILQRQYNDWLLQTYRSPERLREAWAVGAEKTGSNLLTRLVSQPGDTPSWQLEVHLPSEASLEVRPGSNAVLKVRLRKTDRTDWHVQLKHSPLNLQAGRYYTLTFRARADCARSMSIGVSMDHEPWAGLGLWHWAPITTNWTAGRVGFAASTNESRARLAFVVGGADGDVEIDDVALQPGGRIGLGDGESMTRGTVRVFGVTETRARATDRMRFLAYTEKAYFDEMRRFVRSELRCGALVTGTAVFGPLSLYTQSEMDYVDAHAYWQHPHFPGRPWDRSDWVVEPQAMVDHPEWATLPALACSRLDGKPFTVSEYNHPAPNDYQAECVPFVASAAAAQDWDGVWLFDYASSPPAGPRVAFDSFFDIDANPSKLGFLWAGAALFRDGGLASLRGSLTVGPAPREDPLSAACRWQQESAGDLKRAFAANGRPPLEALPAYRLGFSWRPGTRIRLPTSRSEAPVVTWPVIQGKGHYRVQTPTVLAWIGWSDMTATSGVRVVAPPFASVIMAPLDAATRHPGQLLLITACGRCENTDMGFSADRRTVGRNWGHAPVRIEPVSGAIPLPPGSWRAWALGADGLKRTEVPLTAVKDQGEELPLSAGFGTLWYLVERR